MENQDNPYASPKNWALSPEQKFWIDMAHDKIKLYAMFTGSIVVNIVTAGTGVYKILHTNYETGFDSILKLGTATAVSAFLFVFCVGMIVQISQDQDLQCPT